MLPRIFLSPFALEYVMLMSNATLLMLFSRNPKIVWLLETTFFLHTERRRRAGGASNECMQLQK